MLKQQHERSIDSLDMLDMKGESPDLRGGDVKTGDGLLVLAHGRPLVRMIFLPAEGTSNYY